MFWLWPDFCQVGELTHLPLVPHICDSVLDLGNGSAWIQVMAGHHIPLAPSNYPNSPRLIANCQGQVSDAQNVRNCHKQVLNNKTVWNYVLSILQYITSFNKMLKKKFIFFFHFHQIILLCHHQCMSFWLIMNHYSSYFIIYMSHSHQYPKHSETVWNWWAIPVLDIVYYSHKQVSHWLKLNPALGNSFVKMHLNMSSHVRRNSGDFVHWEMS